jgi:hypothetical protein
MNRAHLALALALAFGSGAVAGGAVVTLGRPRAAVVQVPAVALTAPAPRARVVPCVPAAEPEPCRPCPQVPRMPGRTPDEQARADQPESPIVGTLLASCERGRNELRQRLLRCVRGEPEPEPSAPVAEPEQDNEILMRSYDVPIMVRRVDGSMRVYSEGEWPPAGGVGHGNRVVAKLVRHDGGRDWFCPLEAGQDCPEPRSPLLMLDGGRAE